MESPFTNFTGPGDNHNEDLIHYEGILLESPFADLTGITDTLVSEEVFKVGDATLTVAEPSPSGNPLLAVKPGDRALHLSSHFTVGEFARAQTGKYKFDVVRIDPVLLSNLEKLRNFLGRPVSIVDGYYTSKYLKEVLGVKDNRRISLNPHIDGRGVKITAGGYKGMMKQLAIAALVSCDRDINLGIGDSTMTLYVRQPLSLPLKDREEDFQRIVSYISNEKVKVAAYTFCVDVKRILFTHADVYEKAMNKAVSAFAAIILKIQYNQDIPVDWMAWEKPLGDAISLMHSKSITQDPDMILYCIAYSPFGNLYRNFLKNRDPRQAVDYMINELTNAGDRANRHIRGTFLALQDEPDKTGFINNCRQRIMVGKRSDGTKYHLSPVSFFDWTGHPQDKIFKDKFSEFIKKVYLDNHYEYNVPAQQSPVGGTRRSMEKTPPDPDKPVIDFTGRYIAVYPADHQTLHGHYVDINQAGYYISGKMGDIVKKFPIGDIRKSVKEFYGKVDGNGNAICPLYPQQTLLLKKIQDKIWLFLFKNPPVDPILKVSLVPVSKRPVISSLILDAFGKPGAKNRDLMITLAWIPPFPEHLKAFLDSFKKIISAVKEAITGYNKVNETRPSLKESGLHRNISALDTAADNYPKAPPIMQSFYKYYTKFIYSAAPHWSPRDDRPTSSLLDWIKKMLEDYRDFTETDNVEKLHKRLYDYFDIETKKSDALFEYEVKIKLTSFGVGPFARSSGTITVFNKTDPAKYPADKKWTEKEFPIVLWNATLSLNPLKWTPKIATGQTIEATSKKTIYYRDTDFSGADIEITEGKILEIPVSGTSGDTKVGTKAGIGGSVILIDTQGQKTLTLEQDLQFSLPDTIEIEPSDSSEKEGLYEKIAGFLPSLTMYKGSIDTVNTTKDLKSVPLPDHFAATYQLNDTRFFMHDNPVLTAQAIEAVGRLCAEELVAFSDPASQIEIYGHADASGGQQHNLDLSLLRALNVQTAIEDRLGKKRRASFKTVEGLGESEANKKYGEFTEKNAWLRRVVVIVNGRAVLSLGE
jgi:hypothetical protein